MTSTQKLVIEVICKVLYVPAMVALFGLSVWWFQVTGQFENPVLFFLWSLLRATPGILGFTGMAMGAIVMGERWF
jgi:hypothetical protein